MMWRCFICNQMVSEITLHHLVPQCLYGGREEKIQVCKSCHVKVHRIFSNEELAEKYNTLETLRDAIIRYGGGGLV